MKVVVILSGGMDSSTLLFSLKKQRHELVAIGFNYGQRHHVELKSAQNIARIAGVRYQTIDISSLAPIIAGQSSQLNPDISVPSGEYTKESMKATVVPNRNMIMIAIAVGHAIALNFGAVAYGAHAGDHTLYPDCREEFVLSMKQSIRLCDWQNIELLAPYLDKNKSEILLEGNILSVPFALTWSCYNGGNKHCGTCGTCIERKHAFKQCQLFDPTDYIS